MNGDILFTKCDLIHGSHVKDTSSAKKSKPRKGDHGRVGGHKTSTFPCQNCKPNPQALVSLGFWVPPFNPLNSLPAYSACLVLKIFYFKICLSNIFLFYKFIFNIIVLK
jgi:hypothetical protein